MSELSPEAASLLASERHAQDPSEADRARLRARLTRELGSAAFAGGVAGVAVHETASVAKAGGMSLGAKLGLAGLCAAVIGGVASFTLRGESTKPTQPAPHVAPAPLVEAVKESALESTPEAPEAAPPPQEARRPKLRVEARGASLSRELELLTASQRALRENRFAEALAISKKHETAFPKGLLRVERMAVVALAHCGLGATDHPSVKALLEAAPNSPLSERVRASCGVE